MKKKLTYGLIVALAALMTVDLETAFAQRGNFRGFNGGGAGFRGFRGNRGGFRNRFRGFRRPIIIQQPFIQPFYAQPFVQQQFVQPVYPQGLGVCGGAGFQGFADPCSIGGFSGYGVSQFGMGYGAIGFQQPLFFNQGFGFGRRGFGRRGGFRSGFNAGGAIIGGLIGGLSGF